MKLSKGILIAIAGALGLSCVASAQTVSAEKKGPLQTVLPDLSLNLQMRHVTQRTTDNDSFVDDKARLQVRPTLGSTFFDGSVETAFTWVFVKAPDSVVINRSALYNETTWFPVQGKISATDYKLGTYSYFEQAASEREFGLQQHGLYAEANTPVETTVGTLTFGALTNPTAEFLNNARVNSDDNKLDVSENRTGRETLSLDDNGSTKVTRQDPGYWNDSQVSVSLVPSAAPKLSATLAVEYIQHWDPKYVAVDDDGSDRIEHEGYNSKSLVLNKLAIGYKITDKVSLTNSTRYHLNGFYESRLDESHPDKSGALGQPTATWENRLILSTAIF